MLSLREYIKQAQEQKIAIGHFNISNSDGFWAVVLGAKELSLPVIIGVSEGERDFIGVRQVSAMVQSYRESTGQPVFLNADHTYSFEKIQEAVDAGFDAVLFDGTELSLEDNISTTKRCIDYARSKNPDILVEAEMGFIGKSSKLLDEVPDGVGKLTSPDEARDFVSATGIDLLAPAVGNVHGIIKGGDPALNIDRVSEISQAVGIPLVLHGASGNSVEDIRSAIKAGVAIVHVNTELRVAYRSGLVKSLSDDHEEVAPYKYLKPARLAMQRVVEEKLRIISG